jgi:HmuY protein
MKNMKNVKMITALLLVGVVYASCKKDKFVPATVEEKVLLVNGDPTGGNFTLYNLESGTIVANSDSATNKWDFGIRFERFIMNSNASGPGVAAVQIVDGVFDNYATAPEANYAYDTTATKLAIKGSNWYNYDPIARVFSPKAGKIFVFKTNNGKYAKLEMLTADPTDDNGNAVIPPTRPTKIKYKLRKAVQLDGTRNF